MKAKKHLGQHFLTSKKALADIIREGKLTVDDIVLEIGPGKGILTEALLVEAGKVVVVEKDTDLIPYLGEKFAKEIKSKKLEIIQADILDLTAHSLQLKDYKLIANIPYYITGAIIRKFLSGQNQPEKMVLLVQREVAERIVAKDGKESLLSLSVKVFGEPRIVSRVPRGAFSPPPTVDSAIITIETRKNEGYLRNAGDERHFFEVLHAGFAHPRKMLLGNLSKHYTNDLKALFESLEISPKVRSEDVPLHTWLLLAHALRQKI